MIKFATRHHTHAPPSLRQGMTTFQPLLHGGDRVVANLQGAGGIAATWAGGMFDNLKFYFFVSRVDVCDQR